MEKQQTAVDFYDQQLHILDLRLKSGSITIGEYFTLKSELFAQSKHMEKEQKIKFAKHCLDKALDLDIRTAFFNAEQYYNETFKKE